MPKADLSNLSFVELARARNSLIEDIADLEAELKDANAELLRRAEAGIENSYKEKGEQSGLTRFEHEGCKIAVEVRKTIKWDQNDLRALSNAMPPEVAARIFEVELAIPDKIMSAMAKTDISLYAKLNTARTVKFSAPSIKQIEPPTE